MASTTNGPGNAWLEQPPFQDYYLYSSLPVNSFRLLELYPAEDFDIIRGRLVDTDIDLNPQYEAISYHWGDLERRSIELDGFMLHTTRSTESALRQVRRRDEVRCVWIDAVCINQDDLSERARQVKLMGKVFSNADQVLICIRDPATSQLRESLESIHAAFEPVDRIPGYPTPSRNFFVKVQADLPRDVLGAGFLELRLFVKNLWFSRVWVLQEVGLSRRASLFCNDWSISFQKVIFAVSFLTTQKLRAKNDYNLQRRKIYPLMKDFWSPEKPQDFWEVLHHTRSHKASDLRDKVFALLGHPSALNSSGLDMLVRPDYRKSLKQVYYEVTCSLMKGPRPLRVLSSVFHPKTCSVSDLSWIPQWHRLHSDIFGFDPRFDCSMTTSACFEVQDDLKGLKVRGVLFDTITYVSKPIKPHCITRAHGSNNPITEIWGELQALEQSPYPTSKSILESYLQTLTANNFWWHCSGKLSSLVPNGDIEESFHQVLKNFQVIGFEPSLEAVMGSSTDDLLVKDKAVLYFVEQVRQAVVRRRLARSHRGFYGLVPDAAKENDVICILFGSTVPFILRSDGASGTWRLVGECYLHGIMYGEGIKMWREGLLEDQIFHILG